MRKKPTLKENFTSTVTDATPWRVADVKAQPNYQLNVTFNDGTQGIVDMKKLIHSDKAGVFAQLKDTRKFNQVYVSLGVVTWPGEIDLAPDNMYQALKEDDLWTPE